MATIFVRSRCCLLCIGGLFTWLWRRRSVPAHDKSIPANDPVLASNLRIEITASGSGQSFDAPSRNYGAPTLGAEVLAKQSAQAWVPLGQPAKVGNFALPGGLLYIGKELVRQDGRGPDNCLINPKLSIVDPRSRVPDMPYYPSYSEVPPDARGYYLKWLAGGKNDPAVSIGYFFLYFYGLERRLMLDRVGEEYDGLVAEVTRLRQLYGANYSVNRYTQALLEAARILKPGRKYYEDDPPGVQRNYELPLSIRLAVGQLLAESKPIPWNWMFAWVFNDPSTNLKTAANRASAEFKELFKARFEQSNPGGFKLRPPKKRLLWSYRAASASFQVDLVSAIGDLPDVAGLSGPVNQMQVIVERCMADLDAYSRFVGRRPEARGSVQAVALLPPELVSKASSEDVRALRVWLDSVLEKGPALVDSGELVSKINNNSDIADGRTAIRTCAEILAGFEVALMPNPRVSLQLPKVGQPFVLYRYKGSEIADNELAAYRPASLSLIFAVFVAHADGDLSAIEQQRLFQLAQGAAGLSDRGRVDLQAHLKWLLAVPPELNSLRSKLGSLSPDDRRQLGEIALSVASADADVRPAEVEALQRIYKALGLNQDGVIGDLHARISLFCPSPRTHRCATGIGSPKSSISSGNMLQLASAGP